MSTVEFGGHTVDLDHVTRDTHSYRLTVKYRDEETEEGYYKGHRALLVNLLSDVEPGDVDEDIVSKSMRRRFREGSESIIPHSREELTVGIIRLALSEMEERTDYDGDIEQLVHIEITEETTVRESRYEG